MGASNKPLQRKAKEGLARARSARKFGRSPAQHIKGQQPAGSRLTANEKPAPNTTAGNILEVISAA